MAWIVHATPPSSGWSFPPKYFPSDVADKATALARAEEARKSGGKGVRIEKVKSGKKTKV